ncbi:MAG TPA: ABC transporter substrate-binding protein [Nevskiaceae bacterium]
MMPSHAAADSAVTKLNIAMVPVLDAAPFLYAKAQGYYKDAGLEVTFSTNDAGAAVVTGVLNGTYNAAAAAWFPIAIAISKGAPLKYVMASAVDNPVGGYAEAGLVVKPDSGIKGYKDLEGKTVATNALTSLTTLDTKIMMKRAGADPDKVRFVALPFKSSVQAVVQGQVDAAVVVTPFTTEGVQAGLVNLGDPITEASPQYGAGLVLFTSDASAKKNAKALEAFTNATYRAAAELKASEKLTREVAHKIVGLSESVAQKVPLADFNTQPFNVEALQKQLDQAHEYGYLAHPLKAKDVILPQ